jgi:hypothetical protein
MICGSPALVTDTRTLLNGKALSKAITASRPVRGREGVRGAVNQGVYRRR